MAQIGCYLTDAEAKRLDDYAASMELKRPAVCALVIQRELRKPRLKPAGRRRPARIVLDEGLRVTVHLRNAPLKRAFSDHVRSLGIGSDEAAAILFRRELEEEWLFKMFGYPGNRG